MTNIKRNRLHTAIFLAALLMLAACSQDELAEQGDTLPEGMYHPITDRQHHACSMEHSHDNP